MPIIYFKEDIFSFNERTSFADGYYPNEMIMGDLRINYHLMKNLCSKCRICFSVCRYGSITFDTTAFPSFNQCVDCGLCLNACPCNAVAENANTRIELINEEIQVLACNNALDRLSINTLKDKGIGVFVVECLGRLKAEMLFDLVNKTKRLILIACTREECHFASNSSKIEVIAYLVNKVLSQLGKEQKIELIKTSKLENMINSYSINIIEGGETRNGNII